MSLDSARRRNIAGGQENAGVEDNTSGTKFDVAIKPKSDTESNLDFPVKSFILACPPLYALAS